MSETEPRVPGCACHLEIGDSECPVHVVCTFCGDPLADDDPRRAWASPVCSDECAQELAYEF